MPIATPNPTSPATPVAPGAELERPTEQTVPASPSTPSSDGGRRRRRPLLIGAGVLVVGAIGVVAATSGSGSDGDAPAEAVTIRAVEAQQRDLVETTDLDGTLAFADVTTVTAAAEGTVTSVAADGSTLVRGDVLYAVNAEPVTVFYGDVPFYRTLSFGSAGDDVLLLEQNLASLGYHATEDDDGEEVDTGFTVDGEFDQATADAVRRWQGDLEIEETGVVTPNAVVMVAGPTTISSIDVSVGDRIQPGVPIASLNGDGTEAAFYSAHTGEIELIASSGEVVSGSVLYTVDDLPVVAIVTTETFDRSLFDGVADGDDVEVLEQMLLDLGYDADGDLDVDDEFDEATTEALSDFEEDLQDTWDDAVVDGQLTADEFVIVEPGVRIDDVTDRDGSTVATGAELFTYGTDSGGRIVTTAIPVADQDKLSEGAEIDVEFPDGSIVTGTVTDVASSSTIDPTDPTADPTLAVEIALPTVPDSAAELNELDVKVLIVDNLAAGATVVPASALVATLDGGFAVEVVTGSSTTQFVAVDPGMFADGFVEVTGIEPGTAVVVPS
ncbi:MAG: peptidoglycan-binding domain-containing protein [Actinomycetota bacterium]